ncbi:MAG: hypothetical protein OXQ89_02300 [Rhodospirillaceae bacterium]|nr:hypothetical protein [Rhodospirillaceae bacterium]
MKNIADDEVFSFSLEDDTVQVDEIHIATPKLGWIIGRIQSNISIINVVELWTGAVVDSVLGYRPAVSPERRWVAYVKMFPTRAMTSSYQYLIYDITESVLAHRADNETNTDVANNVDVGFSVYPTGSRNEPGSNLMLSASDRRVMRTPGFFWLTDSTYAFADEWVGGYDVVVVDLYYGPRGAVVRRGSLGAVLREGERLAEPCARFPGARVSPIGVSDIQRIEDGNGGVVAVTLGSTRQACDRSLEGEVWVMEVR